MSSEHGEDEDGEDEIMSSDEPSDVSKIVPSWSPSLQVTLWQSSDPEDHIGPDHMDDAPDTDAGSSAPLPHEPVYDVCIMYHPYSLIFCIYSGGIPQHCSMQFLATWYALGRSPQNRGLQVSL